MKKYIQVMKNMWDEMVTYRLNFTMWRVRNVLGLLTLYYLWSSLLSGNASIGAYSKPLMLTYVFGTSFFNAVVLSSRTQEVGEEINKGDLSRFLIRPINYFFYWVSKDVADKAMNVIFSLGELTLLFLILKPPIFIQTNILTILLVLVSTAIALSLNFLISLMLGFVGFWSPETWAPRFIFGIILYFFAGGMFPLDIFPKTIFTIFKLLPFTYLVFFPIKIYLGQTSGPEILFGIAVSSLWVVLIYRLDSVIWKKGLKEYTAVGS
jgi:ABC-2 type transport system permease protein